MSTAALAVNMASMAANLGAVSDASLHWNQARGTSRTNCYVWVETYPWTQCSSFLYTQNIKMETLWALNPSVGRDCYGWTSGNRYCVYGITIGRPSPDGSCGRSSPYSCIGSSYGECCGKNDRCGSTDDYCAIGNCQGGNCPGLGYTTDGKCGIDNDSLRCGGPYGKCCSKAGQCGSTNAECGIGNCQSGDCVASTTTTTSTTTTSSTATSAPSLPPFSPSPDGTCGGQSKYKCTDTKYNYGQCCGATGYCGFSDWECRDTLGCQNDFGLCDKTVQVVLNATTTAPTTSSTPRPTSSIFSDTFDRKELGPAWSTYDGNFSIGTSRTVLSASSNSTTEAKAIITNLNVDNFAFNLTLFNLLKNVGTVGALFRVGNLGAGADNFSGYFAGIGDDFVTLGKSDGKWTELAHASMPISSATFYNMSVRAVGNDLRVYINDMVTPKIRIQDGTFKKGLCGIRTNHVFGWYDNVTLTYV